MTERGTTKINPDSSISVNLLRSAIRLTLKPLFDKISSIALQRAVLNVPAMITVQGRGVKVEPVRIGDVAAEKISRAHPADKTGLILYFHGGGYCLGNAQLSRPITCSLTRETGFVTYSVNYSLAPESPFPTALNEALQVYIELRKQYPQLPLFVAGDSAGGHLALTLTLHLTANGLTPPDGLYLISPWVDIGLHHARTVSAKVDDPMLSLTALERWAHHFTPVKDADNPLLFPLKAALTGLPKTLIQVGSDEILEPDALALQEALTSAGVSSQLEIWMGLWHVFHLHVNVLEVSDRAIKRAANFMCECAKQARPETKCPSVAG